MTMWERVEELARRVGELEAHPERLGSSEKHFDRRVEGLERETELQWRCLRAEYASGLLQRIEALEGKTAHLIGPEAYSRVVDNFPTQHVMVPDGGTDAAFEKRMHDAQTRLQQADALKHPEVEAVERGLMPPPMVPVVALSLHEELRAEMAREKRLLEDAIGLLERWLEGYGGTHDAHLKRRADTSSLLAEWYTLARARVAGEKP